jgi:hypothetical protein
MGDRGTVHYQHPEVRMAVPKVCRAEVRFGRRFACAAQSGKLVSGIRNGIWHDTFGAPGTLVSLRVHLAGRRNRSWTRDLILPG